MAKRYEYEWAVAELDHTGEHTSSEYFDKLTDAMQYAASIEKTVLLLRRTDTRDCCTRDIVIDNNHGRYEFRSLQFDLCYRWFGPCMQSGIECECNFIPERYQLELQAMRD